MLNLIMLHRLFIHIPCLFICTIFLLYLVIRRAMFEHFQYTKGEIRSFQTAHGAIPHELYLIILIFLNLNLFNSTIIFSNYVWLTLHNFY